MWGKAGFSARNPEDCTAVGRPAGRGAGKPTFLMLTFVPTKYNV